MEAPKGHHKVPEGPEPFRVPSPAAVSGTPAAEALIQRLRDEHGPLLFHQSGGCCDGSAPMCFPVGEFKIGSRDVLLGEVAGCEVYIGAAQYELWKHTGLILDVVPGRGAGFSLEAPLGVRFLTRSCMLKPLDSQEQPA